MTTAQRRDQITALLAGAAGPVSASALAEQLGVSRQVVVGDIALLRAAGVKIQATPRGYVLGSRAAAGYTALLACCHTDEAGLRAELYTVVDNGGVVEDVIVENPLYGELCGRLQIASRYDADIFVRKAGAEPDSLLSRLTGGVHLHTLRCPDEESFLRIRSQLAAQGLLYEKSPRGTGTPAGQGDTTSTPQEKGAPGPQENTTPAAQQEGRKTP